MMPESLFLLTARMDDSREFAGYSPFERRICNRRCGETTSVVVAASLRESSLDVLGTTSTVNKELHHQGAKPSGFVVLVSASGRPRPHPLPPRASAGLAPASRPRHNPNLNPNLASPPELHVSHPKQRLSSAATLTYTLTCAARAGICHPNTPAPPHPISRASILLTCPPTS